MTDAHCRPLDDDEKFGTDVCRIERFEVFMSCRSMFTKFTDNFFFTSLCFDEYAALEILNCPEGELCTLHSILKDKFLLNMQLLDAIGGIGRIFRFRLLPVDVLSA